MRRLRFLVAPDKFKGSLSASEIAQAIATGIHRVLPSARVRLLPLADGGDGTAQILSQILRARIIRATIHNPLGEKRSSSFGLRGTTAYLDFASASGLHMIASFQRNPMQTTSRGVGELMDAAINHGAKKLILGVGGSATVDGGMGAMKALGIRFLNRRGKEVPEGGKGLLTLKHIDLNRCRLKDQGIEIVILADVMNPLLGKNGAARVFGPQKGANPQMVLQLEKGLQCLNRAMIPHHKKSLAQVLSGGAAGGVVAGLLGALGHVRGVNVRAVRGIDYVLDELKVADHMKQVDWVFTGEGQLDFQTSQGKTIEGVTRLAKKIHKPVVAFAGKVLLNSKEMKSLGLQGAFTIVPGPCSLEESFKNSKVWLSDTVARVVQLL